MVNIVGAESHAGKPGGAAMLPSGPAGDGPDLMGRFTFEAGQVGGFCAASCGSSQHTLPVGLRPYSSRDVSTSTSFIRTRCFAAAGGGREPRNSWSRDSTLQVVGRTEEDKEREEREMEVKAMEESGGGGAPG